MLSKACFENKALHDIILWFYSCCGFVFGLPDKMASLPQHSPHIGSIQQVSGAEATFILSFIHSAK